MFGLSPAPGNAFTSKSKFSMEKHPCTPAKGEAANTSYTISAECSATLTATAVEPVELVTVPPVRLFAYGGNTRCATSCPVEDTTWFGTTSEFNCEGSLKKRASNRVPVVAEPISFGFRLMNSGLKTLSVQVNPPGTSWCTAVNGPAEAFSIRLRNAEAKPSLHLSLGCGLPAPIAVKVIAVSG